MTAKRVGQKNALTITCRQSGAEAGLSFGRKPAYGVYHTQCSLGEARALALRRGACWDVEKRRVVQGALAVSGWW